MNRHNTPYDNVSYPEGSYSKPEGSHTLSLYIKNNQLLNLETNENYDVNKMPNDYFLIWIDTMLPITNITHKKLEETIEQIINKGTYSLMIRDCSACYLVNSLVKQKYKKFYICNDLNIVYDPFAPKQLDISINNIICPCIVETFYDIAIENIDLCKRFDIIKVGQIDNLSFYTFDIKQN